LRVTGSERGQWLQGIVTADLLKLSSQAFWGLLLLRTGKLRGELIGIVDGAGIWLAVIGGTLDDIQKYLGSLVVMEDVNLELDPTRSLWGIHGREFTANPLPTAAATTISWGALNWIGTQDRVYAVPDVAESEWLAQLRKAGLEPTDDESFEQYRIRAGMPKWSVDYTFQDTPHHAGLFGRAVAPNKGCYIGQEVVCKVEMRGHVSQRVARIRLDSLAGVSVGADVIERQTGESAGAITSVAPLQSGQDAWALARIKLPLIEKAADIQVGQTKGRVADILAE
jgi:folate-binding protein YgfZ